MSEVASSVFFTLNNVIGSDVNLIPGSNNDAIGSGGVDQVSDSSVMLSTLPAMNTSMFESPVHLNIP